MTYQSIITFFLFSILILSSFSCEKVYLDRVDDLQAESEACTDGLVLEAEFVGRIQHSAGLDVALRDDGVQVFEGIDDYFYPINTDLGANGEYLWPESTVRLNGLRKKMRLQDVKPAATIVIGCAGAPPGPVVVPNDIQRFLDSLNCQGMLYSVNSFGSSAAGALVEASLTVFRIGNQPFTIDASGTLVDVFMDGELYQIPLVNAPENTSILIGCQGYQMPDWAPEFISLVTVMGWNGILLPYRQEFQIPGCQIQGFDTQGPEGILTTRVVFQADDGEITKIGIKINGITYWLGPQGSGQVRVLVFGSGPTAPRANIYSSSPLPGLIVGVPFTCQ